MHGWKRFMLAACLSVGVTVSAMADIPDYPSVELLVNGKGGCEATVFPGEAVTLQLNLDVGEFLGAPVDWWVIGVMPSGTYSYRLQSRVWRPGLVASLQAPLVNVKSYNISMGSLSEGEYSFYFGVDRRRNGRMDFGLLSYSKLKLTVKSAPAQVLIPAGRFTMGDSFAEGLASELPTNTVYVSAFYMDKCEVTKAVWDEVYQWAVANGYTFDYVGSGKAADHPAHTLNWYDAVKWCNARSEKEGLQPVYFTDGGLTEVYRAGQMSPNVHWSAGGYRLPTEAEWEKAARGGVEGRRFPWGDSDTITHSQANYHSESEFPYDISPTRGFVPGSEVGGDACTTAAGTLVANGYGLYDMAGNVYEWCWDWDSDQPYGAAPRVDPRGPEQGARRVMRGGSWLGNATGCRAACSLSDDPTWGQFDHGFRTVRSAWTQPAQALIPAGRFMMGDSFAEGLASELPTNTVYVSAFYMDKCEVTKAVWDEVYQWAVANGYTFDYAGSGKAADHPAQTLNWYDAVKWCNARSEKEGLQPVYFTDSGLTEVYRAGQTSPNVHWSSGGYRLPTEAEWEKAARGGVEGRRFPWGDSDTITHSQANYHSESEFPYDISPTRGFVPGSEVGGYPCTTAAGTLVANGYGLYDMAGNVYEWCWDWDSDQPYGAAPRVDPRGPEQGARRVMRGGSWLGNATGCRAACSLSDDPAWGQFDHGFRTVRSAWTQPAQALIPAGRFTMGDGFAEGFASELPTNTVYVSAFYMDKCEVTKAVWDEVYQWAVANGYTFDYVGSGKAADHPAHTLNWYDAVKWCNARSEKEGLQPVYFTDGGLTEVYRAGQTSPNVHWSAGGYRLPTEAEWEKAARGGVEGRRFPWGDSDTITHSQANYHSESEFLYDISPSRGFVPGSDAGGYPCTTAAGTLVANGYGLYDMAGNVFEWCWDWDSDQPYGAAPRVDPRGPEQGERRVMRGGSWLGNATGCRVAGSFCDDPTWGQWDHGFRSVRSSGQQ